MGTVAGWAKMLPSKAEPSLQGVRAHGGGCGEGLKFAGVNSGRTLERGEGFPREGGLGACLEGCW